MIIQDKVKMLIIPPGEEIGEICAVCDEEVFAGKSVLRHHTTRKIICFTCLKEIAELA